MSTPEQPADFAARFMEDYFAECEEHLIAVRRGLLALESAIGQPEPPSAVVEELFRSFHSLKGISAMVELRDAERLAHELESCLRAIRQRETVLSTEALDALVDGVDVLEQVIAARRSNGEPPSVTQPLDRLAEVSRTARPATAPASATPPPAAAGQVWKVTFTPSADLVARGIKVDTIRGRLMRAGQIQSVAPRVTGGGIAFDFQVIAASGDAFASWREDGIEAELVPEAAPVAPVEPAVPDARGDRASGRSFDSLLGQTNFVRVDLARLDDLMRLVGDLVVSRARLEDALLRVERFTPAPEWRTLQEHSESIERHLRDLREGVMRVRLVPVGEMFRRVPFVVRDLARDNGKRIQLDLAGQATEIDKFLVERMLDPMLHLVRNAVSHGIESPEQRIADGKRPEGTIRLAASTVGESVMLEIGDDGRGMDGAAIGRRAREKGIDVPDGVLDARALLDVISAAGFSTRDAADRVSGRGVGMSVVRDTIQDLGGTLSLETAPGQGTTFRITLPLTLAITDALIVHAGDRVFAVPQSSVREVAEVDAATIHAIENNELITHRAAALPVVRLARLFGIPESPRPRLHVIVVGTGSSAVGLLVDRIAGQREVVVKTLKDPLVKVTGVSGATELGDGRLVLILEPAALTRKLRAHPPARAAV
jgi:two-component system chemotaxis sensor kinase CheA